MAWIAFVALSTTGIGLLIWAMTSDPAAARVDKMSFFLGTLFGVWGGIVAAYFGTAAWTDVKKKP